MKAPAETRKIPDHERLLVRMAMYDRVSEFLAVGSQHFPRLFDKIDDGRRPHEKTVTTYGVIEGVTEEELRMLGHGRSFFWGIGRNGKLGVRIDHYPKDYTILPDGIAITFFDDDNPVNELQDLLTGRGTILPSGDARQAANAYIANEVDMVENRFAITAKAIREGRIKPAPQEIIEQVSR